MWSEGDQVPLWIWKEVQIRVFPGGQMVFGKTGSDHLWQSCRRVEKDYNWKLAIWFGIREVTSIGTIFGGMVDKCMWVICSREMWRLMIEPVIKNDILHFEGIYCEEEQRRGLTAGKSTVKFLVVCFLLEMFIMRNLEWRWNNVVRLGSHWNTPSVRFGDHFECGRPWSNWRICQYS